MYRFIGFLLRFLIAPRASGEVHGGIEHAQHSNVDGQRTSAEFVWYHMVRFPFFWP
jgi:hypothetical protein